MRDWMIERVQLEYSEVRADQPGIVPLAPVAVFDFFDRYRDH